MSSSKREGKRECKSRVFSLEAVLDFSNSRDGCRSQCWPHAALGHCLNKPSYENKKINFLNEIITMMTKVILKYLQADSYKDRSTDGNISLSNVQAWARRQLQLALVMNQ